MEIKSIYTLKQPLSHIGESESTTTFLNTIRVLRGGKVEEVFAYTGNAIRGQLRDCAAQHLMRELGIKIHKKEFNILFSGGNISGTMTTDVGQAAQYRELLPIVSLFGAGIGSQILSGKIAQGFALPICRETDEIIPPIDGTENLRELSWRSMTGTVSFTRMDDSKDIALQEFLADTDTESSKKKADGEASTQMRYEVEYMVPGTMLYHVMALQEAEPVELGCLVTAFREFASSPTLGGMGGKGFGLCDLDAEFGPEERLTIKDNQFKATYGLLEAETEYLDHIRTRTFEIVNLLGGTA